METQRRVLLSVEQYLEEVLALVEPLGSERLPLVQADGRVLAEAVTSAEQVPTFANSAMDGFAVRHADLSLGVVLREVAERQAAQRLAGGPAARTATEDEQSTGGTA